MPTGIGGYAYLLLLTDDYSRHTIGYTLKTKDEALAKFQEYLAYAENHWRHRGLTLRAIQYDNGTVFTSGPFHQLCKEKGITEQLSLPYCPEQNGLAALNKTASLNDTTASSRQWSSLCELTLACRRETGRLRCGMHF